MTAAATLGSAGVELLVVGALDDVIVERVGSAVVRVEPVGVEGFVPVGRGFAAPLVQLVTSSGAHIAAAMNTDTIFIRRTVHPFGRG